MKLAQREETVAHITNWTAIIKKIPRNVIMEFWYCIGSCKLWSISMRLHNSIER